MGFRKDAYATVWEVVPEKNYRTRVRVSTSKKNKLTGEFEQDFGGFVRFVGTANAKAALGLKKKDRIKLGDCEVTTRYDNDSKKAYTNFLVYGFEKHNFDEDNGYGGGQSPEEINEPENKQLPF